MALFGRRDTEPLRLSLGDTKDGQGTFLVDNDDTKRPEFWTEAEVEQNRRFKEFLTLAPRPFVTVTLIGINVAVFLVMAASGVSMSNPVPAQFVRWGADSALLTTHGQWWRLLTSMFLHFGFVHLASNMFCLFQVGGFTEQLFGRTRFALLYVFAGIGGGIVSDYWTAAVSAGASGAVFGIYGGLLGFLLLQSTLVPAHRIRSIGKGALIFVGINLFYSMATPGINLAAHVGGFVTGLIFGGALTRSRLRSDRTVRLRLAVIDVAVAMAIFGGLAFRLPAWDDLQAELQRLAAVEKSTSALANPLTNPPRTARAGASVAEEITGQILPQLDAERQRISALRLPYQQRGIAETIGKYVSLREDGMALLAKALQSGDMKSLQAALKDLQAANDIAASLATNGARAIRQKKP